MDLGAIGYGLSILVYEIGNTVIAILVYRNMFKPETKSTDHKLSHKLGWFACESLKNMLTIFHVFFAYEFVIVIITQLHNDAQLGAYTILFTLGDALRLFAKGFTIFGRTELNKYIGRGKFKTAKGIFFKVFMFLGVFAVILHVVLYFVF